MKLERVPVRYLDISADEAHLLAVAALKFEDRRTKDEEHIAAILLDMDERGVDLDVGTGFDDRELAKMLDRVTDANSAAGKKSKGKADTGTVGGRKALQYKVVVECRDEDHQTELLELFDAQGVTCRPLMS